MQLRIDTIIPAPADVVWHHLQTPALLEHVAAPMIRFRPVRPARFPAVWQEGDYVVGMRAFGLIPLGRQTVGIRKLAVNGWPKRLLDAGYGQLVSRWDHEIELEPEGEAATRYCDTVTIEAGLLTPVVWGWAQIFYRHRQRRWRALARNGFAALNPA